ncbi:MAG: sigma-70 family RNA polymerase sigma factor [Acidimicrobiia bacterium]|nr:sigma-70 family RNA polymerase sigma factor [Acidimicrobiia bacterium]
MNLTAEERFEQLYIAHQSAIRDYCVRRLAPSLVEDAVADVFAVAWRKIDSAPADSDVLRWLYAVAYRVLYHQWRRSGRAERLTERVQSLSQPPHMDAAEIVLLHEDYRRVLQASQRLSVGDQEILRLTLWEELPLNDVAEILGIKHNAAKQRSFRARRRLVSAFRDATREIADSRVTGKELKNEV